MDYVIDVKHTSRVDMKQLIGPHKLIVVVGVCYGGVEFEGTKARNFTPNSLLPSMLVKTSFKNTYKSSSCSVNCGSSVS